MQKLLDNYDDMNHGLNMTFQSSEGHHFISIADNKSPRHTFNNSATPGRIDRRVQKVLSGEQSSKYSKHIDRQLSQTSATNMRKNAGSRGAQKK